MTTKNLSFVVIAVLWGSLFPRTYCFSGEGNNTSEFDPPVIPCQNADYEFPVAKLVELTGSGQSPAPGNEVYRIPEGKEFAWKIKDIQPGKYFIGLFLQAGWSGGLQYIDGNTGFPNHTFLFHNGRRVSFSRFQPPVRVQGEFMGQILSANRIPLNNNDELRLPKNFAGRMMVGPLCLYKERPSDSIMDVSMTGWMDSDSDDRYRLNIDITPPPSETDSCATAMITITSVLPSPQSVDVSFQILDYFCSPVVAFQEKVVLSPYKPWLRKIEFTWGKSDRYRALLGIRDNSGYQTESWREVFSPICDGFRRFLWISEGWEYKVVAGQNFLILSQTKENNWQRVDLPHVPYQKGIPLQDDDHILWFRRKIVIPKWMDRDGNIMRLVLTRAGYETTVYWNGKKVYAGADPHSPISIEIPFPIRRTGENEILIGLRDDIATLAPSEQKDHRGKVGRYETVISPEGIFGLEEVYLESVPRQGIEEVTITTSFRKKQIRISYKIPAAEAAACQIESRILHRGTPVLSFPSLEVPQDGIAVISHQWENPVLWSIWDPRLLCLESRLVKDGREIDIHRIRFGFREVWAEKNRVFLNGTRIKLAGVAMTDNRTRAICRNYLRMGKRRGLTARLHTDTSPLTQDINDEEGLLSFVFCNGVVGVTDQRTRCDEYWRNAARFTRRAIQTLRNHPSILGWSISNEWARQDPLALARLQRLGEVAKHEDPIRFVQANCDLDLNGWGEIISTHYPIDILAVRKPEYYLPDSALWYPVGQKLVRGMRIPCGQVKTVANIPQESPITYGEKPIFINETGWKLQYNPPKGFAAILGDRAFLGLVSAAEGHHSLNRWFLSRHREVEPALINPWDWCYNDHILRTIPPVDIVVLESYSRWYGGEMVPFHVNLHWDKPSAEKVVYRIEGREETGRRFFFREETLSFSPAELIRRDIILPLPAVEEKTGITIYHSLILPGGETARQLTIRGRLYPRKRNAEKFEKIFLFDPEQTSAAFLTAAGVKFQALAAGEIANLDQNSIIIIARNAANHASLRNTADEWKEFVRCGGRVFLLHQDSAVEWLPIPLRPLGIRRSSICFRRAPNHPILSGLDDDDVKFWYPDHVVGRGDFLKPPYGGCISILDSADGQSGMEFTPLIEQTAGDGTVVAAQIDFESAMEKSPVARELFFNILRYLRDRKPSTLKAACYAENPDIPNTLREIGAQITELNELKETSLADQSLLLAEADILTPQDVPVLRGWMEKGGILLVHHTGPQSRNLVDGLTGGNKFRIYEHYPTPFRGRYLRSDQCPYLDGLSNEDFFWKKDPTSQNYIPTYVDPEWAKDDILTYPVEFLGGKNHGYPPALSEIAIGKGKLIVDQLRWDTLEPSVRNKAWRIASCLLANFGCRFVSPATLSFPAHLRYTPLDISAHLNRRLADEVDNDGKDGWTDQGKELDMRALATGLQTFHGVPFRIEQDKSCLVLASRHRKATVPSAVKNIPIGQAADVLYFLHTCAWGRDGVPQAKYVIHYEDGTKTAIALVPGENYRDWTAGNPQEPFFLEKGTQSRLAFTTPRAKEWPYHRSVYMMGWRNPHPQKKIRSFDFLGKNDGVPILLAVTLGQAEKKISRQPPATQGDRNKAENLYAKAEAAMTAGNLQEARKQAASALEADPSFLAARVLSARIYIRNGQFPQAEEELRKCIAADARQFDAYLILGELLEKQNRFHEALKVYEASLEVNRNQPIIIEGIDRINKQLRPAR